MPCSSLLDLHYYSMKKIHVKNYTILFKTPSYYTRIYTAAGILNVASFIDNRAVY